LYLVKSGYLSYPTSHVFDEVLQKLEAFSGVVGIRNLAPYSFFLRKLRVDL
jgi:hypothetical protein